MSRQPQIGPGFLVRDQSPRDHDTIRFFNVVTTSPDVVTALKQRIVLGYHEAATSLVSGKHSL